MSYKPVADQQPDRYKISTMEFSSALQNFVQGMSEHVSTKDGEWNVKGFKEERQKREARRHSSA